jgi:hypothetical protein
MERFVRNANIEHYRGLIAESEFNPSQMLLTLPAEELCQGQEAMQLGGLPPHGSRVQTAASIHLVSTKECFFWA